MITVILLFMFGYLPPSHVVMYGRVLDDNGKPVASAQIKARVSLDTTIIPIIWGGTQRARYISAVTDRDGRFELATSGRPWALTITAVDADGFLPPGSDGIAQGYAFSVDRNTPINAADNPKVYIIKRKDSK